MMKIFLPVFLAIMKNCITLFVSFDSVEWSDLYKTINNKICNECINHIVNVNDVEIPSKTKTWQK